MRPLFFVVLLASAAASAQTLEVLGWSEDGGYVALIEHGVGDGSGFPWGTLTILETAKNKPAASARVDLRNDGASEADAVTQLKKKAEAERKRLKISRWVPGKTIAHDEKGALREPEGNPIGTLELKPTRATRKQQARECAEPFGAFLMKVELSLLDAEKPLVVLDEKRVPKERACVTTCQLGPVYAQAKGALFVLQCAIQGFEGPGKLYYPVAARLPVGH